MVNTWDNSDADGVYSNGNNWSTGNKPVAAEATSIPDTSAIGACNLDEGTASLGDFIIYTSGEFNATSYDVICRILNTGAAMLYAQTTGDFTATLPSNSSNYGVLGNATAVINMGSGNWLVCAIRLDNATGVLTSGVLEIFGHFANANPISININAGVNANGGTIKFTGNSAVQGITVWPTNQANVVIDKGAGVVQAYLAARHINCTNLTVTAGTYAAYRYDGGAATNITVTGTLDISGTVDAANAATGTPAVVLNILNVRAGGTYIMTPGTTFIDDTSFLSGTLQFKNGSILRGTTGGENIAMNSSPDWDYGGAGSIVGLYGIVIVANTDLTTGGAGVRINLTSVNFSSPITDRILTISEGDTLHISENSTTNLHVDVDVNGTLSTTSGKTFTCANIDVFGIGKIVTPGISYINQNLGFDYYTTTFRKGTRMASPIRIKNSVIRGDYYVGDVDTLEGCDIGMGGYSY